MARGILLLLPLLPLLAVSGCTDAINPAGAKVYYALGVQAMEEYGDYAAAEEHFSRAVRRTRAWVFEKMNDVEGAINEYNKLLATAPDDVEAYRLRAQVLGDLSRCEEAAADLERTLKLDPESPWTLNNLAWIYLTCGGENFSGAR